MLKNRMKKNNSFIVGVVGIAIIFFIGLKILYPKNDFDSEKRNKAVTTIQFLDEKRGYLTVDPEFEYNFYSASVEIYPKNIFLENKIVEVEKGFIAQLYPIGEMIETAEVLQKYIFSNDIEIPNGELVSTNDAVYVYSRGKWKPFLGPQFFQDLGFDWKRVKSLKVDEESSFEEGEKIIAGTPHPDGTILETKDKNFFLVWEEKLLPIKKEEIIKEVWPDYAVILMDKEVPEKIGECKNFKSTNSFECFFDKKDVKDISGNTFVFSFGEIVSEIKRATIVLDTFNLVDLENPKLTLSFHKTRIIDKYRNEIFK